MEETLKAIQRQLQDLADTNADVVARLSNLEEGKVANEKNEDSLEEKFAASEKGLLTETAGVNRGPTPTYYNPGKEKSLSLTFGED